jgi:hypothetical protein
MLRSKRPLRQRHPRTRRDIGNKLAVRISRYCFNCSMRCGFGHGLFAPAPWRPAQPFRSPNLDSIPAKKALKSRSSGRREFLPRRCSRTRRAAFPQPANSKTRSGNGSTPVRSPPPLHCPDRGW